MSKRKAQFSRKQAGYLFDNYETAIFGYALVRLKAGHTYACRVERSSDSATTDVELYDTGFIDGSSTVSAGGDLSTWVGSDTARVIIWYDQSGNSYDVGSAYASAPDLYTAGTLQTKDSLAAIKAASTGMSYGSAVASLADGQDFSIFSVVAATNSNDYGQTFSTDSATTNNCGLILDTRTQKRAGWCLTTGTDAISNLSTRLIDLDRHIQTMIVDGGAKELVGTWHDGTAGDSAIAWTNTYNNGSIRIADVASFNGYLNGVFALTGDKSGSRAAIETQITADFSL